MNSTTKRLLRGIEILAWAAFFVFAALVLALRFWVLPDIERYREDIVAAVSRGIGLPVRVGAIEAGWLGLRPQITLTDVRIHDAEGREALALPSIHNVVAWSSLLHGELRLHRLAIERPRLTIRRDAAGELHIAGLKLARGQGGSGGGAGGWLLGQGEIVVHDAEVEWRDEQRGAPPLLLSGVELRLAGSGSSLALGLSARPPAELGKDFELRAEIDTAGQPSGWSGRVFLQVGYTDLAAWRTWLDYPLNVRQGQGALRVWTSVEHGQVKRLTADLALANVNASLGDELSPLELVSLNGRVQGRILDDGAELSGKQLALVMTRGTEIPPTDFQIVWRPQAGGALGASALDLEVIAHLVESLPLPPQIAGMLRELAPRGRLADARMEWSGPFDAPTRLSAKGRFSDLALRARGDVPGFAGLSGSIEATLDRGKLHLASRKAELELPRVFLDPRLALDTLNGDLEWERDARGFGVRVSSLSFANAHASGNLFGNYARRDEGPGVIDLSAVLSRADGTAVARYLPQAPLLKEELRNWLARAIVAGESSDVRVRLRGDLRQFPFTDPASGQFQVTARVDKGVLDYADGWPRIHDIAGELNFEREKMEIVARSGAILGARLANVRVSIPNLRTPERHLLVSGQADGPSEEFLKFLASSPLRDKVGSFVTSLKALGRGRLHLHLDLPLAELARTRIAGEYDFAGNQVTLASWLPPVDQANGRFTFTESSFKLHEARGRLLGGAVTAAGGTQPGRGLEINARGNATVEAGRAVLDHPLNKLLAGGFAYTVAVRAQEGGSGAASGARVTFDSNLRGVASSLPAPLAKGGAESLPLRVEVIPAAAGQRDRITLSLGSLARAEVSRRKQGDEMVVQRAAVWLSPERDQPIRLPERPGTLVYGALGSFDADRWLALFPAASLTAAPQPGAQSPPASQPLALDLRFGSLDALGKRFSNFALRASAQTSGWTANLAADEVAGDVSYRAGKGARIVARLARLTIPDDTPGLKPAPAAGASGGGGPGETPAIDLVADEFIFRGKELGRVELLARRDGADWRIDNFSMVNADASLTGRGVWSGAPSRTAMEFDLNAANVGAFLARVGQPGLVRAGKAHLQGSLAWRGNPGTLDFPTLNGDLTLNAENGQFLEIEPGLGKLIGLMSLQSLPKRITLDFRDVFSKGFQFDRITAAARVENGAIRLKEPLRMRGSAAEVEMTGEADLARETQNLRVRVVPSLADSASIGIAIVNPVAGVAAAIAQRLLKNPLGQIFAFDYAVSGTWVDPKVVKITPPPQQSEFVAQ